MLWFRGRPTVWAERRTWADLQKPVRSATGGRKSEREGERERESNAVSASHNLKSVVTECCRLGW